MMKKILTLLAFTALFLSAGSVVAPAFAGPYDSPSVTKNILIDKRVGLPHNSKGNTTYTFVDNISADTYAFNPSDIVFFELHVKNTSNVALTDVEVTDFGPIHFDIYENPGVKVDGENTIKIKAGDFAAGEEKVFSVRGRIHNTDKVSLGTTCIVNRARAAAGSVSDEDTAQFCFKKGMTTTTKVETIPSTGPEHTLMIMGLASVLGYVGTRLKKLA